MEPIQKKKINALFIFVIISYSVTWAILFPLSIIFNQLNQVQRELWHALGSIGPTIGGITVIYLLKRKEGLAWLRDRILQYSGWKLLIFAFSPLIILFFALLVEWVLGIFNLGIFLLENNLTSPVSIVIFILPSLCYGFFEEVGWRGYLLPALQEKYNALFSTLILTVIWWFWHFPTFFYRFDLFYGFILMFPLMLMGSIVFTFLYNQSKGSLLMIIILHISYDLVSSHQISLAAIIIVSAFYIFMDIRILKVYGLESFSSLGKTILFT
jgi:membrane protease YdiL (CAAX protease family)